MSFVLKLSTFLFLCFFVMACNQSEENEAGSDQNAISTNTSIAPLIVPDPTQTTPTTPTIHDIWVLDSINNKVPDSNFFSYGTPYFDFNLDKKTISGHTGCNGINGKLKVQGEKLILIVLLSQTSFVKTRTLKKNLSMDLKAGEQHIKY